MRSLPKRSDDSDFGASLVAARVRDRGECKTAALEWLVHVFFTHDLHLHFRSAGHRRLQDNSATMKRMHAVCLLASLPNFLLDVTGIPCCHGFNADESYNKKMQEGQATGGVMNASSPSSDPDLCHTRKQGIPRNFAPPPPSGVKRQRASFAPHQLDRVPQRQVTKDDVPQVAALPKTTRLFETDAVTIGHRVSAVREPIISISDTAKQAKADFVVAFAASRHVRERVRLLRTRDGEARAPPVAFEAFVVTS